MAQGKKSFIFYSNWKDTFDALPDDKAGELIKHIFAYVNDENPESDDVLINAVFATIKNTLKDDLKKWEKQQEQRIRAGKASAEKRKRNATSVNERSISSTVNVNGNVNVNDNVSNKLDINSRKINFAQSIKDIFDSDFNDVDLKIMKEFIDYWTEHGENDKKMRFEKQKSFNKKLRIGRWLK